MVHSQSQHLEVTGLSAAADKPAGVLRLAYRGVGDGSAQWALIRPGKTTDWVVVIHGHGSGGDQLYVRPDLRDHWLPALVDRGVGILTPDLRGNAWMSPAAAEEMHALVGWLRREHGAARVIFASGSMGGTSNLIYAAVYPADVAGVVALCPATDLRTYYAWCRSRSKAGDVLEKIADAIAAGYGGEPTESAGAYEKHSAVANAARLTMPVWMSHSEGDAVIPVSEPRALAAAMTGHDGFKYEEMPGGHHDSTLGRFEEGLQWVLTRMER